MKTAACNRPVLFSIRPFYADKILAGQKTVELRRRFPEAGMSGSIAMIYCTSPVKAVVGSAQIKGVQRLSLAKLWSSHGRAACIAKDDFNEYFAGQDHGFAIILDGANTIRKVYLCRAPTNQVQPGDMLFFYMSKDERYAATQSITTVGIAEQISLAGSLDDLMRVTAKRSVFSATELEHFGATKSDPVKVIDFLLVGHAEHPIGLNALVMDGVFSGRPPQSIMRLSEERYQALKSLVRLGFDY